MALLAGLALALLPAAAAAAAPPWRSAERMQAALFDAQTALLLDGPDGAAGTAERRVRDAARAFRGPLAAGLAAADSTRGVRAALREATARRTPATRSPSPPPAAACARR